MAHALFMLDKYGYTHTHSEYVMLLAFPVKQWFRERALCYVICTLLVPLKWVTYQNQNLKGRRLLNTQLDLRFNPSLFAEEYK